MIEDASETHRVSISVYQLISVEKIFVPPLLIFPQKFFQPGQIISIEQINAIGF